MFLILLCPLAVHAQQADSPVTPADSLLTRPDIFTSETITSDTMTSDTMTSGTFDPLIEADTIVMGPAVMGPAVPADTSAKAHSPKKASVYSAVLPGLGQAYNKKYWKIPIVYAGLGALVYSSVWNGQQYNHYKNKYKYMYDNDLEEYEDQVIQEVEWYKDAHRRYRDLFLIFSAGFYALQIIDATVDAYLIDFDVSKDLSLRIEPVMISPPLQPDAFGLRLCLVF